MVRWTHYPACENPVSVRLEPSRERKWFIPHSARFCKIGITLRVQMALGSPALKRRYDRFAFIQTPPVILP